MNIVYHLTDNAFSWDSEIEFHARCLPDDGTPDNTKIIEQFLPSVSPLDTTEEIIAMAQRIAETIPEGQCVIVDCQSILFWALIHSLKRRGRVFDVAFNKNNKFTGFREY